MEELKLTVRALAAQMKTSIEELAKLAGIEYNHLRMVSAGRVKMTADDLIKLSKACGVPPENIEH